MSFSKNLISHNVKNKCYPDGLIHTTICNKPIFVESGWECTEERIHKENIHKPQNKDNASRNDSVSRARTKVFDIAYMNDFTQFITFTFNGEKFARSDITTIMKTVKKTLDNWVQRYNLKYLLLPEYHLDGNNIHCHALGSGNYQLIDSGTVTTNLYKKPIKIETAIRKGIPENEWHKVYNMPQWKYGWSTAINLYGEKKNVCRYITKYITKDLQKIFGNYYYAGGHVIRNVPVMLSDMNYEDVQAKEFCVEDINLKFKYLEVMG